MPPVGLTAQPRGYSGLVSSILSKECFPMGLQDKIANRARVLKSKAKEAAGKITNDPLLEVEGKLD